ncbi:MAG: type II toxin-antitoxin system HipA family toxin [Candidatus Melainabacteria bacterium]|nr:MAG: type II toxin-antitoxin system HipA family toxin [Candidatus Melainabacteria bacterium]
MDTEVYVHVELDEQNFLVGKLWARSRGNRESATFEYDDKWLSNPLRFSLEPSLKVGPGPFHTLNDRTLFGSFGDSAPDRWGRTLMRRAERLEATAEKRAVRSLREIDYLLGVNDFARQGALRFSLKENGSYLSTDGKKKIPPLINLSKLLSASKKVLSDKESSEDLKLLLAPGSSLGGARPKASILDKDGQLAIAKFPHTADEINTVIWEAVALTLAEQAGISVPVWRLEEIENNSVLLLRRFDRDGLRRIPFLSAMSMLNARDNEQRSYLELADILRVYGSSVKTDLHELWRRIVFSTMISNTDDHLRNHGFLLYGNGGWRISPVYDINPVPLDIKPRILSTCIDLDDGTASLELALSVHKYFDLSETEAKEIINKVKSSVKNWRKVASDFGIKKTEIERMKSAFL